MVYQRALALLIVSGYQQEVQANMASQINNSITLCMLNLCFHLFMTDELLIDAQSHNKKGNPLCILLWLQSCEKKVTFK